MEIRRLQESLNHSFGAGFDVYERRPGDYQLIVPIRHEDGDMIDVYLQDSPRGEGYVRICDFGMTLMRPFLYLRDNHASSPADLRKHPYQQ